MSAARDIARPSPAVVIAVGDFAAQSARQVRCIYQRGDDRRRHASAFYQLLACEGEGWALAALEEQGTDQGPQAGSQAGSFLEERANALNSAVKSAAALKAGLERILHEQRVHERLIAAGWLTPYNVPLDFYILADTGDPSAAGALLPLAAALNETLANTSLCRAHWLLAAAAFPGDASNHDLAVWSLMQAFDDLLRLRSEGRERLAAAMQSHYRQPPDFAVYLFDTRKEGAAVVRDRPGLNTLLGNALLALLQGDLAQQFFLARDEDAMIQHASFYNAIGAAALVYDPASLQAACARQVARAFLTEKILCPPTDEQASISLAHHWRTRLGGPFDWLDSLLRILPRAVGQVRVQPDTLAASALLPDLTLAQIDYLKVRHTPWWRELGEYRQHFTGETLPEAAGKLDENCEALRRRLEETLRTAFDRLPLETSLYPGGLQNARGALQLLADSLEQAGRDLEKAARHNSECKAQLEEKLQARGRDMQAQLAQVPEIRALLRLLPGFLRQWLAPFYIMRRYAHRIYLAQSLRDECLNLLKELCGAELAALALSRLQALLPPLQERLDAAGRDLDALEAKLAQALEAIDPGWGSFPLAAAENGWDPLFRRPALGPLLAEWARSRWQPELDPWVLAFLGNTTLFADWRLADAAAVLEWALAQGRLAYQPVWDLTLENIFDLWAEGKLAPVKEPAVYVVPFEQELSSLTLSASQGAAIPPIRPNFDAVGGSAGATSAYYALTADPAWRRCCLPPHQDGTVSWQAVYTGDPYCAIFLQARRNVPLAALADSYGQALWRLESLPPEQREAYDLLAALDHRSPSTIETVDPNDPDLVHKTFQWKFRPKGSSVEFEQSIQLPISRARFEYYRRQPRLNRQWNAYAELEMPEVRLLATEFQKLHAQHRWSTFNQAWNVLKFVQQCVTYTHDCDTTGHQDWARYPIETLYECTGDCEDVAILCAAVIARFGLQVVLLLYPPAGSYDSHHLAFGVAGADNLKGDYAVDPDSGQRYFYGEATSDGWRLGEIPGNYRGILPEQILPVKILIEEDKEELEDTESRKG
jgi:hypothetical protein